MPGTTKHVEHFKAGTKEVRIKKEQQIHLKGGAKSCTYVGSESKGWTMTTILRNLV